MCLNLKDAYHDYFKLRESNVEGRADVFGSLFNQARQIDLERRKLLAEVEVLRLKDQNNAATMQDLESMFRDQGYQQENEMR
jgi:hypothetical protein